MQFTLEEFYEQQNNTDIKDEQLWKFMFLKEFWKISVLLNI